MKFKILFVLTFLVAVPPTLGEIHESVKFHPMRQRRSIKDTFPKVDYGKSSAINYVRNKVFSLQDSVKKAEGRIQELSNQNEELEESMREQKSLLQAIAGEFSGIQEGLSAHGYRLNEVEELTNPTKNFFVTSNQTCGGVLEGQLGSILFRKHLSTNRTVPSNCVWTVRAGNRAFIKVSKLVTVTYSSNNNVYVTEVIKSNTSGNDARSQLPRIKTTRLLDNAQHLFAGPVIFVLAAINSQSYIDLHLQFEGMGKVIEKTTFFTHTTLLADPMRNFSSSELPTWSPSILEKLDGKTNYTLDYTTIVVSNFTTKAHLQAAVGNGGCSNGESFIVISDLKENKTSVNDCCKMNCTGLNSLINYDNPYIFLIQKKFQQSFTFNLTWVADPVYLPSSDASSCGGIVGGSGGIVRYKPFLPYGNNERCIWVIVPQPIPKSSIEIKVTSNGITDSDDHLYMMELTDVNGKELDGGPKMTSLAQAQRYSSYVAHSREVYIVFYTDSVVSGNGFSVTWVSSGDLVRNGSNVETQFEYFKTDNGSAISVPNKAIFTSDFYHVLIFTPKLSSTYDSGLQLELNQTFPAFDGNDCVQTQYSAYIPVHGVLTKTAIPCNHSSQAFLKNADGMAVIVMMKSQTAHPNLAMDFNWKQERSTVNRTEVVVQDDRCGGVIIGDKGVLNYKTEKRILDNERCLWLLNAPTSTNVTLKLEKDGFDNGIGNVYYSTSYAYILVTTIDPKTGTLRNDTVKINRAHKSHKVEGPMIVIEFRSGSSGRGTGFSLRFSPRETYKSQSEYTYKLRHLSNTHGTVEYDGTGKTNDVFVIASSAGPHRTGNPIVIDWSGGLFRKANDSCTYDSLKFYEPTSSRGIDGASWFHSTVAQLPNHNGTQCPDVLSVPEKKNIYNSTSVYLAIYKPVSNPQISGENETISHFRFDYYAPVIYTSCSGIITEDSGHISYKENSLYSNGERCRWQIHIPQAEKISFYLERSGLEQCCDVVTINPETSLDGVRLSLANRSTIIKGNKAEVTFSSDGSGNGHGFRLRFESIADLDVRGQKCGGVIQQQSGSITYARHELTSLPFPTFSTYYPSTCVWTVRANDSASIKISTHQSRRTAFSSYNSDTYVVEIIKTNTSENTTSSQIPQIKITKLQKNMQYLFSVPTIFVVTSLATPNGVDLYLQFEGVGKVEQNDTSYFHETLLGSSGTFNSNDLETLSSPFLTILDDDINNNFTLDYTTIVISNFSTKVHLQAAVGNGGCSNGESFFVITDVTKNNTVITDCCKTDCTGNNSLITYDNPFVILITKKYQEPFNFNLTWEADLMYPSSSNQSGLVKKCGEVVGGTSGTIEYKFYDKNDRCIWVIVPQPLPRSSILLKVNLHGIYDSNDLLYMMELTDINGEELVDAPKITRFSGRNTYEARSREVYIVLYADSSGPGVGFSLTWSLQGEIIEPRNDVVTRFSFLKSNNGSATNAWRKSLFTSGSYDAFIFTPSIPSTYKYGLQLQLQFNDTLIGDGGNNCTLEDLTIFTTLNGLLTKTKAICDEPGDVILDEADGMAVIVLNSRQNVSSEMQLDFKWMNESDSDNSSGLIENGDQCGGIIIGSKGVLRYKLDSKYLNGERCIWLLHSPNSSSITFKLLDDGFERCCDYVLVTTIDPKTGTLRNNTMEITRANKTQILEDPMVVIQFRSDSSVPGTGFALRYSARGHKQHDYGFNLRHTSDSNGTFEFPAPGWNDTATGARDIIHVMASSILTEDDNDEHPRTPLAIDWSGGVFQKANDSCNYNSIMFYEPTFYSDGAWLTRAQFPNQNETSCSDEVTVPGKQKFFMSGNPAFLAIFKPLPPSRDDEVGTSYHFDYHQIASSFSCGDIMKAEYGMGWISYKERATYTNGEKCVWQVEIPQAVAISFHLDVSGVERCCDFITVNTIESPAVKLTNNHGIATVRGSIANITFTSDSSVEGSGFRVSFENSTVMEDDNCGGVIIGDAGLLNYKLNKVYQNNERCVWLLHSPQSTNITLELVENGFESCCDYLLVNTIDPNTGTLRNDTAVINGVNNTQTFEESLVVIVFRSDHSSRGRGFSLQFSAGGNDPNPNYIYRLRHVSNENGTITYPGSEWGDGISASNDIFVLASSVNLRDRDEQTLLNINWESGVFRKSNESCEYGSVMFYTSPKSNGWETAARIPNENAISSCSNVVTVPPNKRLCNIEDLSYLVVYKPNSVDQHQENATQFNFTLEMGNSCGGVYIGNSGEISYKENGRYVNDEICIWLVQVPGAYSIAFTLAKSGFEECCDYITVSSVDAFTGIKSPASVLASTNETALISGSVAIVTFTADGGVVGSGFRLLFNSASQATRESPYTYILAHAYQPNLIQFSQQVEPNQVIIFAYGRSFKFPSVINIKSFRPQVNESCYSDSLAVYEAYGKRSNEFALKKRFTAADAGNIGTNCRAFDEKQFSACENIGDCNDAPNGNALILNSTSYVVIYSSVNATGSLRPRGFALTSQPIG